MNLPTDNPQKRRAHALLDDVRAGLHHETAAVVWALRTLGEPVELLNLHPLEAQGQRSNGAASLRSLRARPEVAISSADSNVYQAHASSSGNGASAYQVARRIA